MKTELKVKSAAELMQEKIAEMTTNSEKQQYISQEFQDFGYRLAVRLNDLTRKALYIKLAKSMPRALIEDAAAFATDYPNAKNKGKLFMWKLNELVGEYALSHPEFKTQLGSRKKSKPKLKSKAKPSKGLKPKAKQASQITFSEFIM